MKDKSILLVLMVSAIFMAGCFGSIQVVKDDFRNVSIVKMQINHWLSANAVYTREFSGAKKNPAVINFKFSTSSYASNLENKVIFKAGEKNYELAFGDISGEVHTNVNLSQNKTTTYTADNTGFVDYTKGSTSTTDVNMHSHSYKIFSAKLVISDELEKAILSEQKIAMRIYYGTEPSTYKIEGDDLQKVKNFLLSTPDNIVKDKAKESEG